MPVPKDNIDAIFRALESEYDLGTVDDFRANLKSPEVRKYLFETAGKNYDLGPSLDVFEESIGFKKKEDGGVDLSSYRPSVLQLASTEPPKRLTYSDINAKIESVTKAQKNLKTVEVRQMQYGAGYIPTVVDANKKAESFAMSELDKATKDKQAVFTEYSKEISRPVEKLIETGEYKNFFTPSGNLDYGKAKQHFLKVTDQLGGGPALVEHWVANLKQRGQGEMERAAIEPEYKKNLESMGLGKYADPEKYGRSIIDGLNKKYSSQTDLVIQDRDQRASAALGTSKQKVDSLTQDFNNTAESLNDMLQNGQLDEASAKSQYNTAREQYESAVNAIDKEYRSSIAGINKSVEQKYNRIKKEIDALYEDPDLVSKSIPEADKKNIEKAYTTARAKYTSSKEAVDRAVDEASGTAGLFARSVTSGFLSGISNIGDALASNGYQNGLVDWMQSKRTAAEEIKPAQYEWSKDPLKRAITSSGQSLGASAPLLIPSIAATMATGGGTSGIVASALLSYYGENKQNAGQLYRDVLENTGDVNLAREKADEYLGKTQVTLPLYFVGSLGDKALLLGKGLKKAAAGFGLEMLEETPVEYIQSHAEETTKGTYKGGIGQYVLDNPEMLLDLTVGTAVQSGAMKTVGAAFAKVAKNVPSSPTQTYADAVINQGSAFAVRLAQAQFEQGMITEQERDSRIEQIKAISANMARLDELGVRGDAAKLHMALSEELKTLKQDRQQESDESVQAVIDGKIKETQDAMTNILSGKAEMIVFGMPGDVNSKVMLASQFNTLPADEQDQMVLNAKSVTAINNDQLNTQLQDKKLALGNPEGAPDGAYNEDATLQSARQQQAVSPKGGVQERPGTDGGQQEVGQGARQQGQAPVTVPDTGDSVRRSEEEVGTRLAGELSQELEQDYQPIIDRVAQSYRRANISFEIVDDAEFTARTGQEAEGAFISTDKSGKILFSRQRMEAAGPGLVIWHEAAHPVMNTIRNTNRPLYDKMVSGLKQLAQNNQELASVLKWADQYAAKIKETGGTERAAIETADDEAVVESIAQIAKSPELLASLPRSIKQTMIEFINSVAKMLGIKGRIADVNDAATFRRMAREISRALKEGRDISEIVGKENVMEYGAPIGEPTQLRLPDTEGAPVVHNGREYELSFVKPEDVIDIDALLSEIVKENKRVWFWVADQLGRGMYFDRVIDGDHYLDAGPSFAFDPKNRGKGVVWATGKGKKWAEGMIANSDYIFIISGSPTKSKLFNKRVSELVFGRIKKSIGTENAWDVFKSEVLAVSGKKVINEILNKYNSFEEIIASPSPDRKKLLLEFDAVSELKGTPLKGVLEKYNAFVDFNNLRDGFFKENGFELNDVMLVLKPTGFGGKSSHSTYENDILGEVIGVPDKKINAFDLMTDEFKSKYSPDIIRTQQSQAVAPWGAGIQNIQYSLGNRQAIIDKAKADGTYLKAPNGQPTKLTEDQWTTVRTPEFKSWFGDWENDPQNASKVMGNNGEPMVVYHGTDKTFDTFMSSKAEGWGDGMYFASNLDDTKEFGETLYEVFLNIRRPVTESNKADISEDVERTKVWEAESKRRGRWDSEEGVSYLNYRSEEEENIDLVNKAWRELGYDGIMFEGSNNLTGMEIVTFNPNQIKSATANVGTFSTEDSRIQFSMGGRPKVGKINWEKSPEGKGDPSISSRNPIVVKAAQDLKNGVISNEEYRATVSENSPIGPITRFFEPATLNEMRRAVSSDKVPRIDNPVEDGTVVGLRLDIPAYKNNNTWVVSVHEGRKETGESISYTNVAKINNVDFVPKPKGALNIAAGKEKVSTIRMFGTWENIPGANTKERGENAKRMVQEIADNPSYVQVGMNPFRHSYFYDRNTDMGRPIKSADEVIQVGGLVYAKNPVYGEWTDEAYAVKGLLDSAGQQVQFSVGNRDSIIQYLSKVDPAIKQSLKNMSEPSAVTAGDGAMFFRMPDGTYSDGNDTYDSWDSLRQVGENNRLDLRQSTPEEIVNRRYEDKYILDNLLEEAENEILQKEFNSKMEVWNFFNDEGLKRFGYDSPMEMPAVDRKIHAALVKKGVEEFERKELSTLADAYELIGKSVDESIADAYLKAKADGTNQEFVDRVDSAINVQFSMGNRPEQRREFKLVAFVLRKKAEGYTDGQIAFAINSALPTMTPQEVLSLLRDPKQYLQNAFPGMTSLQYTNLLRRAEIANIYRPRGFTPKVTEMFLSMGVDQEVLDRYYMRVKTRRQVIAETIDGWFKKGFDPAKGLPKWVLEAKEMARGARNLEIAQAKKTLDKLAAVSKKIGFDDWELFKLAMKSVDLNAGNTTMALAPYAPSSAPLSGLSLEPPVRANNPVLARLPLEIQPFVTRMRNQIDGLSNKLVAGGFVNPAVAVAIEKNLGQYLNRSYRLFNEKGFTPTPAAYNAAVDYLANEEYRVLLQEFYDKNVKPELPSNQARIGTDQESGQQIDIPYADLMVQAVENAKRRVDDIITRKDNPYFGSGSVESRDTGILKTRKFIPVAIRELMGEYTDPGITFMMTVAKQASLAASSQFLKDLRKQGLGTMFFEKNDPDRPQGFNTPIAGEKSSALEPLNGLYTTAEIYEALQDAEVTRNNVVKLWMQIVGTNRWFKTVGSIRTQFVNFESNLGFAVMNGLIFTKEGRPLGRGMSESGSYVSGQYRTETEMSEITKKVIALGLVGQDIDINAIKQAFKENDMFEMALDVALTDKGVFKKVSKKVRPMAEFNKLYRMGDDFWKVYGYMSERAQIAKLRFGGQYESLTPEQQEAIDREAADRVKDTWPTYDRMWQSIRYLSQNVPILGNFVAFQAESMRVLINAGKLVAKDRKDPQMRTAAARRAGGMLAYVGLRAVITTAVPLSLGYGVSGIIGALINDDDKEDKKWALKEVAPMFMRTGDIIAYQNKQKPHMYTVADMLSIDPLGITARSMNAFTEGNETFDPGFAASMSELVGGFFEREMTFKAVEDLTMNNNSKNGLPIWGNEDSDLEAASKIAKYAWDAVKPSTIGLVERAITNENKIAEATAFGGFRPYEIDLHKSFNISLSKMQNSLNEISTDYIKIKFDEKKTEEEKEQARIRAGEKKAAVVQKYHRLYSTLIKLGADPAVMTEIVDKKSAVKMTGMDDKTKAAIIDGKIDATTFY